MYIVTMLILILCRVHHAKTPLSMEFSRQEYWSGVPFSSPGYLPNPGTEPSFPVLQANSLPYEPPGKPLLVTTNLFPKSVTLFLFCYYSIVCTGFPGGSEVKNQPAMQEAQEVQVGSLGWEASLEEEMETH